MGESGQDDAQLSEILRLLKQKRAILVVGAGIGVSVGGPSGKELSEAIAERFSLDDVKSSDMRDVCQEVMDIRQGARQQIEEIVVDRLQKLETSPAIEKLCSYPWSTAFTTNFDDLLERGFRKQVSGRTVQTVKEDNPDVNFFDPTKFYVFKLMGSMDVASPSDGRMVLSSHDYSTALVKRRGYFRLLTSALRSGTAVFIGYSFQDRIVLDLLREIQESLGPDSLPKIYALMKGPLDTESHYYTKLVNKNVMPIDCDLDTFTEYIDENWDAVPDIPGPSLVIDIPINGKKIPIPVNMVTALGPHTSVLHLRTPLEKVELRDFLLGKTDSWYPLKERMEFFRDAENEPGNGIRSRVGLECRSKESRDNRILIIGGDAGSGKSILLRSLACEHFLLRELPVIHVTELGVTIPFESYDEFMGEILRNYSDTVKERGKGEEVKFLVAIDNARANLSFALNLFDYLTGMGRPILMVLADRGESIQDFESDCRGLSRIVPASDFYFLRDELGESELKRLASYLIKNNLTGESESQIIETIQREYESSFFASMYSYAEPTRPPLTQISKGEYLSLPIEKKKLFLQVAVFHQFGYRVPFDLLRRAANLRFQELVDAVTVPPSSNLLVMIQEEFGPTLVRTTHPLLANKLINIFSSDLQEQSDLIRTCLQEVNFTSQHESEFALGMLINVVGPRAHKSPFTNAQKRELLQSGLVNHGHQAIQHHLALLDMDEGRYEESERTVNEALERGKTLERQEERIEILLTTLGNVKMKQAMKALDSGKIGEANSMIEESRSCLVRTQQSRSEVGHAFHSQGNLEYQLALRPEFQQSRHQLLAKALLLCERGLETTQHEETRMALLGLESKVYSALGFTDKSDESIEEMIALASTEDGYYLASNFLMKLGRESSTIVRQKLLIQAAEVAKTGLKKSPGSSKLLHTQAIISRMLTPGDFRTRLNGLQSYIAQEIYPSPGLLFDAAYCAYQLGYTDKGDELFRRLSEISGGYRQRSRILTRFVDDGGRVYTFNGIVSEIAHAKHGFIKVEGSPLRDTAIRFAPLAIAGPEIQKGERVRFEIGFSYRGPQAINIARL